MRKRHAMHHRQSAASLAALRERAMPFKRIYITKSCAAIRLHSREIRIGLFNRIHQIAIPVRFHVRVWDETQGSAVDAEPHAVGRFRIVDEHVTEMGMVNVGQTQLLSYLSAKENSSPPVTISTSIEAIAAARAAQARYGLDHHGDRRHSVFSHGGKRSIILL